MGLELGLADAVAGGVLTCGSPDQGEGQRGRIARRQGGQDGRDLGPGLRSCAQPEREPHGPLAPPGMLHGGEKSGHVQGVDGAENRRAHALVRGDAEQRGHVLADAVDPPGAVYGA